MREKNDDVKHPVVSVIYIYRHFLVWIIVTLPRIIAINSMLDVIILTASNKVFIVNTRFRDKFY